jgi:hypothetical protein
MARATLRNSSEVCPQVSFGWLLASQFGPAISMYLHETNVISSTNN